jgi:hypothetical protein
MRLEFRFTERRVVQRGAESFFRGTFWRRFRADLLPSMIISAKAVALNRARLSVHLGTRPLGLWL